MQALANPASSASTWCARALPPTLETLEEIAIENAQLFREAGGSRLRYIPCLNDAPDHAAALAAIVRRELAAWDRAG